ncbi:MAG: guanylate cyclase [Alphaproteobacteria bacterium]|nr:guanylate cyclase [Alphaproteobacteria bacterium]
MWWLRPATHASQAAAGDPEQPLSAPRLSIVVLPFANLSNDPEQEYFADGITEDLTTDLSLIPNLLVIARNTASTFKGKAIDVRQVGRELDVRYALEGSVHRTADDVRITAQLIDAERGTHVWADRIDGNVTRLSALQDEVTARLARALDVTLIDTESRRAELERPNNPDAIDFSMRGWAAANRPRSPESLASARDLFEKALRIDPQLVQAQVGLGYATSVAAMYRWSTDPKKDLMVANETILRALQASPNDAVAHLVHGDVFRAQRRFDDAIAEYERAVAENRNLAAAYAQIGGTRTLNGQAQEAFAPVEKAIRLSPRDPLLNVWLFYICHAHTHLAQDDDAIEWCRKSIAVAPFWLPYVDLAAAYGWKGEKREAQQAVEGLLKLMPGYTVQKWATAGWSDNPKFLIEYQRIVEGLRKAGLQEQ